MFVYTLINLFSYSIFLFINKFILLYIIAFTYASPFIYFLFIYIFVFFLLFLCF